MGTKHRLQSRRSIQGGTHEARRSRRTIVIGVALTLAPGSGLGKQWKRKVRRLMSRISSFDRHSPRRSAPRHRHAPRGGSTTQNMKGEKMFDKMSAHCTALSVAAGDKKYFDGACVLADADGDKIFSTFDTRDLDKSQPDMKCGSHIITVAPRLRQIRGHHR